MLRMPEDEGHPIDRIIREAMVEGKFDHLEGHGCPLDMSIPGGERGRAFRLLKNAGFVPEWAELEREIENARASAAAALDQLMQEYDAAAETVRVAASRTPDAPPKGWRARLRLMMTGRPAGGDAGLAGAVERLNGLRDRGLRAYLRRLHAINRMVDRLNLMQPVRGRQLWREDVASAARRLCERLPRARLAAGTRGIEWAAGEVPEEWLRAPTPAEEAAAGRVRGIVQLEALTEYARKRQGAA